MNFGVNETRIEGRGPLKQGVSARREILRFLTVSRDNLRSYDHCDAQIDEEEHPEYLLSLRVLDRC